jgi:small subunit ribosomal protein S17
MADKKVSKENEEAPVDETAAEAADEPTAEAESSSEAPETVAEVAEAEEAVEEPIIEIAAGADEAPATTADEPDADEPAVGAAEVQVEASAENGASAEAADAEKEAKVEEAEEVSAPPAPQSGPKPKKKRLPRALRPKRTKTAPVKPTSRKPIVRLDKPEHDRGRRQERQGTVISSAMDKTIVVKVDTLKAHRRYKKVVRRSTTFHAHDEANQANVGDVVRIVETRPVSKTKRWRLAEIVEAAK